MKISFEFFPPRSERAIENFNAVVTDLKVVQPEYFSVTFGAGGSTQDATLHTVQNLLHNHQVSAVPHLSCIGSNAETILELLHTYQTLGVKKIVALRGDVPSGMRDIGDFHYAYDLVEFIRKHFADVFQITVAAYPEKHPQAKSYDADLEHFLAKFALADSAITQYFYNLDAFLYFRDEVAKHSDKPIIPGIMPITNYENLMRFSAMCGAEIPRWIEQKLAGFNDSESVQEFGFEVVHNLCQNLKQAGVENFHFYSMNKTYPSLALAKSLV